MPTLENLALTDIQAVLKSNSLSKARRLVHQVEHPVRVGNRLTAQVRGSRMYDVEIDVSADSIAAACTCPYDWGGYCKHVGAVLLRWIQSPADFSVQDALAAPTSDYPIEVTPIAPPSTYRPEELPVWLAMSFADRQRAYNQQLFKWLAEIKLQDLRRMAKVRGWKVKGTRKAAIVRQISEQILDPQDVRTAVLNLDDEHRQVLRALILMGENDRGEPEKLADVAGMWGELKSYKNVATYTRHLCEAGLAIPGEVLQSYYFQNDFVPYSIARVLPQVLEGAVPTASHPPSDIDELEFADPFPFVRTVNQVALLLEQSAPPLRPPLPRPHLQKFYSGLEEWDYDAHELVRAKSKNLLRSHNLVLLVPPPAFSLPDQVIKQLAPIAGGEERLEFIYALLVATGIFQPGSPVTVWPEAKEQFLRRSELDQRAILARTFVRMLTWSALWKLLRASDRLLLRRFLSHRYLKPEHLRVHLARFRHVVLRTLASLPDNQWIAVSDLFSLLHIVWPRFDHSVWQEYWRPSYTASWFLTTVDSAEPLDPASAHDWALAQGQFIQEIIAGPLHWLGLADLCWRDGALTAVRFHGMTDVYWERTETPDAPPTIAAPATIPPAAEAMSVDGDVISVTPSAIPAQAHSLLNQIARLDAATAERFVYQLDSQTAHASFEAGVALTELYEAWDDLLPIPMPEAIRDQLSAWWDAYGRVRIYKDLTVVEFGDDYALAEMRAVTSLDQFLVAEISPRLVIISQEAVEPLTEALEKAGYTPKQVNDV